MKNVILLLLLIVTACGVCRAQGQNVPRDTSANLPHLEIPEITIVGKKAITLPFARKGEIYDIDLYEAPPPDTSLLEDRPSIALPLGALPRYEEPLVPWHVSTEGSFGSFSTGKIRALADYQGRRWGFSGSGGFATTQGHTANATGNSFDLGVNARTLVSTDNEILKSFRASLGTQYKHESYGMFGIHEATVERSRNNFTLNAKLSSLDRQTNALDMNLGASIWSLSDTRTPVVDSLRVGSSESQVSIVTPVFAASFASTAGNVRIKAGLSVSGAGGTYAGRGESIEEFALGVQWRVANQWLLELGGRYDQGSNASPLVAPFATLKWELDRDRVASFWLQPAMHLTSYDEYSKLNPYLVSGLDLRSERTPIDVGGSLLYNSRIFSLELRGSFTKGSDHPITIADSGRVFLDYVDANQFIVAAIGLVKPTDDTRLSFNGRFQPAFENGSTTQLPMVPLLQLAGRGELEIHLPLTLWSSIEYWSKQNVDRDGAETLADRVLVSVGASSHILPRTMLSLEIADLFNTAYEWWSGYVAPGRNFKLNAKVNLQ